MRQPTSIRNPVLAALFLGLLACGGEVRVDEGEGGATAAGPGSGAGGPGSGPGTGAGGPGSTASGAGASGPGSTGPGAGPGGSTGSGGEVCPGGSSSCANCVAVACPDVWCACYENADCTALFGCTGDCDGDPDCLGACYAELESGISSAALVADCAAVNCEGECAWADEPLEPCEQCLYTECSGPTNACVAEPDCLGLWQCLTDCAPQGLTCQEACYEEFGDGTELLEALIQCAGADCDGVCEA